MLILSHCDDKRNLIQANKERFILCFTVTLLCSLKLFLHCRAQAIAIGQALVDGRWLDCVTHHDQLFRDEYALYRPLQVIIFINDDVH